MRMHKSYVDTVAENTGMHFFVTQLTSGPTPQVASSAVYMFARANKERKKKKENIERDSNSGRLTHRQ